MADADIRRRIRRGELKLPSNPWNRPFGTEQISLLLDVRRRMRVSGWEVSCPYSEHLKSLRECGAIYG